jgi:long-chain acyl-CoA synthetase
VGRGQSPLEVLVITNSSRLASCFVEHGTKQLCVNAKGETLAYADVTAAAAQAPFSATRRQLVFCMVENDIAALAGYFSLLVADAVVMMVSMTVPQARLEELAAAYKPNFAWLPEARREEFAGAECLLAAGGYCLLDLRNPDGGLHESLTLLLPTSGSTGGVKYVRLSYENVHSNAASISAYLGLGANEVPITTLPPSYSYGLSIIHSHVLAGATLAVTNKTFFDREFWNFISAAQATSMGGVPYHYEMLGKLRFTRMNLPSLRTLTQAGGAMDPALTLQYATHCAERSMRFFSMYGQTEATARMSYVPSHEAIRKAGSIGIAIPGGRFWLEGAAGATVDAADAVGELIYEGPNVSMGYAECRADLAQADVNKGVLRTGDLARRDADGFYFIVGRLKRFIKVHGNRINLADVDGLLAGSGHVAACAGKDNVLEVYALDVDAEKADAIKRLIAANLQIAHTVVSVYGVTELPRGESGKIQYAELQPRLGTLLA